jgi:hypothetical protein
LKIMAVFRTFHCLLGLLVAARALGTRIGRMEDTQEDTRQILDLHNAYRAVHGAEPLVWSSELVDTAAIWAAECRWEHSDRELRQGAGENLYAGVGLPLEDSYAAATIGWYNEISMYNFDDPGDLSKTTRGFVDIGHFTALVWSSTEELGCARQVCPPSEFSPFHEGNASDSEWAFVVCHYKEPGNVLALGEDEYKLFRRNVLRPREDADPVGPIRSCSSDTVTLKIEVTALGATCEAADTLAAALESTANTMVCSHGWTCSGYASSALPFTTSLTLEVPATDAQRVTKTITEDVRLLEMVWAAAAPEGVQISIEAVSVCDVVEDPQCILL